MCPPIVFVVFDVCVFDFVGGVYPLISLIGLSICVCDCTGTVCPSCVPVCFFGDWTLSSVFLSWFICSRNCRYVSGEIVGEDVGVSVRIDRFMLSVDNDPKVVSPELVVNWFSGVSVKVLGEVCCRLFLNRNLPLASLPMFCFGSFLDDGVNCCISDNVWEKSIGSTSPMSFIPGELSVCPLFWFMFYCGGVFRLRWNVVE